MHFIPISSSWLNLFERWFREISEKRIRRDSFRNVDELVETILDYLDHSNDNPRPFVWSAPAERILEKYRRARAVLEKTPSDCDTTLENRPWHEHPEQVPSDAHTPRR